MPRHLTPWSYRLIPRGTGPMRELVPLVFYDHDGFASDGLDAEPTVCWPADLSGDAAWNEAVRLAGPPLYRAPMLSKDEP